MALPDGLIPLIKEDGAPFDAEEVATLSGRLDALTDKERREARDQNSGEIAAHRAAQMLVVSGPGTGKSTLFKARLVHWLAANPDRRVAVATFTRKLVEDLNDDIINDEDLSDDDKSRVSVTTLHSLARSIVEQSRGTQRFRLDRHCLVVTDFWEEMVWLDAVSLHDEFEASDYPWNQMLQSLYDNNRPTEDDWLALRRSHLQLEQFYNALTFADFILGARQAVNESAELVGDTLYILDEFQDFNRAEEALIRAITSESPGVLLAGDDDQVLYDTLRRGLPEVIREYYRDGDFVNAMLPFCSRCSFHICRTAERFLASERRPESITKVFVPLVQEAQAERVAVVASTAPKSGVRYIQDLLTKHREGIQRRQEEIEAGTHKDAYVLILTPAREMRFMNVAGAREDLRETLAVYMREDERPGPDYWRVLDYYHAAARPSQNLNLRKALAHEGVEQHVVAALLREAPDSGSDLADLNHRVVRACLEKCSAIPLIVDGDQNFEDKADAIAALIDISDPGALARDLERRPMRRDPDADAATADLPQRTVVSAVDVRTIFEAKGLSAEHVIVLGCDDENLKRTSRSAFFVALTRARDSLTLLACMQGGGATALHQFICSLPDDHTDAVYARAESVQPFATIAELQEHLAKVDYWRAKQKTTSKS